MNFHPHILKNRRFLLLSLIICLGLRAITLEYPDLMDPTESRYAFVAQEMFLSKNWIEPKLTWHGQVEPYLGKPPFHFWLTALSFTVMGMDEWATRLPSFCGLVVMCLAIFSLRRIEPLKDHIWTSLFVMVSSGLLFFLSGASVVDVTLATCTTVAFASFILLSETDSRRYLKGLFFFGGISLGFLTKGPIAFAIVGLPILCWMFVTRRYDIFKRIPWIFGTLITAAIICPWFIAAEKANPGFLKYFFVNENFKRFLFKEYGDKYGNGHRYPLGSVWWMYLLGFLPWTIPLVETLVRKSRALREKSFWKENQLLIFTAFWAISPGVIFTFGKQLHPAYILPGIPGLAIFSTVLFAKFPSPKKELIYLTMGVCLSSLGLLMLGYGAVHGLDKEILQLSAIPLLALTFYFQRLYKSRSEIFLSTVAVAAYSLSILTLNEVIGAKESTKGMIQCVISQSPDAEPRVGIVDANSYSIYFYSRAWWEEFPKPVAISFHFSDNLEADIPDDLIIRARDLDEIKPLLPPSYQPIISLDRWIWLRKNGINFDKSVCPEADTL